MNHNTYSNKINNPSIQLRSKVAEMFTEYNLTINKDAIEINSIEPIDKYLAKISHEIQQSFTAEMTNSDDDNLYTYVNEFSKGGMKTLEKVINPPYSINDFKKLAEVKGYEFAKKVLDKVIDTARIYIKAVDEYEHSKEIEYQDLRYFFMMDTYKIEVNIEFYHVNFHVYNQVKKEVTEWELLTEQSDLPF